MLKVSVELCDLKNALGRSFRATEGFKINIVYKMYIFKVIFYFDIFVTFEADYCLIVNHFDIHIMF